ncbi:gfo/Idh/MocA family oxidoreductase [Candidatus Methylacidiphilum fumarolicum]|uniref:Predicted dehydrogenase n=2 Tax=Candidatus Methylacidiphilum fumarolicum TaxID=591154 RepID=I0JYM5_METFB|nr:Gfo/Idh/MocA family oxidoreductase [Candidatus Methylacidiphilum fumarolicum]MBW6415178.1 Gfo/Idh/MocA family oxidoreductase [Candidatus Methylacidiphilum fumarolicum]TFE65945.1 oxidoreductase [Candidatus Methylacidiphilum fumarolicum]TFE72678.1 gfo/Idh/MocA family oxidoreductase [Candidatus Methylacidiphilum fumarolicum]TFE73145.1 gfo/Idh/MocA family oxidoreductase [Candidatus Methylacidiphilum fumarolicum]TFE77545.1 oxidoreductase [Candidatus Methylacidiphilum fumarolicum]
MSPIKLGVIGIGHIGKHHARIYAQMDGVHYVGCFDIKKDAAGRLAEAIGGKVFESLEELLKEVDAVSIATPTSTHFTIGSKCLEAGVHVLIEKPITDSLLEAKLLVEIAKKNDVILQVGHVERYNPAFRVLEGYLSQPRFIECHRLCPYPGRNTELGVVLDLMIHDLEAILHLVHSEVQSVDAVGVSVLSLTEDIANARIKFKNGAIANITTSRISPEKMRKIRIFQDDAYISLNYLEQKGEIYRKRDHGIECLPMPIEKGEPLFFELRSFIDCIYSKDSPLVGGKEAVEALKLAVEITEIIRSNKVN